MRAEELKTIVDLCMSSRTTNILMNNGIDTLEDLKGLTKEELFSLRNLGMMSKRELESKLAELAELGIVLKESERELKIKAEIDAELKAEIELEEKIEADRIKSENNLEIESLVNDYNAICAKKMLNHRVKYTGFNEQLVLGNRSQFSYGSYQCELARGAERVICLLKSMNKVMSFEYGED